MKEFKKQIGIFNKLMDDKFVGIHDACIYTHGEGECFVDFMMLRLDDILFMYLACDGESSNHCLFQLKSGQEIQGENEQVADVIRSIRGN